MLETQALLHCAGTAHVAGGTVEYAGETNINAQRFTLAITGGTGALNAAEGHVSIHNLNANGTLSRDVIALAG